MKGSQNQKPSVNLLSKVSSRVQIQFFNVLTYFVLFGCGLTLGIIVTTYLKDFSLNLQFTQFSISTTPSTQSSPSKLSHVISATSSSSSRDDSTDDDDGRTRSRHVGLEQYLAPPSLWHDMSDDELLWRASMAPRIEKYPFRRVPRVAFLFLVRGRVFMAPVWEKFFEGHDGLFSVYVHSNPSYNESEPESPVFRGRRIPSKVIC